MPNTDIPDVGVKSIWNRFFFSCHQD
jgi:hypothetical protein